MMDRRRRPRTSWWSRTGGDESYTKSAPHPTVAEDVGFAWWTPVEVNTGTPSWDDLLDQMVALNAAQMQSAAPAAAAVGELAGLGSLAVAATPASSSHGGGSWRDSYLNAIAELGFRLGPEGGRATFPTTGKDEETEGTDLAAKLKERVVQRAVAAVSVEDEDMESPDD